MNVGFPISIGFDMNKCECCGLHNNYKGLDKIYEFVCLPCVEDGQAGKCEYSGEWHVIEKCGCGREGPANYFGWSTPEYYCGGSDRCVP